MTRSLHAEWTKLRTVAGPGALLLAAAALTAAIGAIAANTVSCPGQACQVDPAKVSLAGIYLSQAVVAIGTVLRRGAAAVAAVIALIAVPYVLTVAIPVAPLGVADWLMRVTPAAAFAIEQTVIQYPQVDEVYSPAYGYFPLAPWAGFAVLCAWTALALALAYIALNRRDA